MSEGEMVAGEGWISDDSSFYGDEDQKKDLSDRASTFNVADYWANHHKLPATIAYKQQKAAAAKKPLLNPFEGEVKGRQLSESVPEFTKRLPPLTTSTAEVGPWIWIANPYVKVTRKEDLAALGKKGEALLEEFKAKEQQIESENKGKARAAITRKLTPLREQLKVDILELATHTDVTSGKWMLFPNNDDLPRVWRLVAEGTAEGQLGTCAKVATVGSDTLAARLICVYTENFAELHDVRRVLGGLVDKGLVRPDSPRGIYYKNDAYTHLGIESKNDYGIVASMYSSAELLKDAKPKGTTRSSK